MWLGNGPRNGVVLETGKRRTTHPTFFFELHRGCGGYFGLARSAPPRPAPVRPGPLRTAGWFKPPLALCNSKLSVAQTPTTPMQFKGGGVVPPDTRHLDLYA